MNWIDMLNQLKERKAEFMDKIIQEINIDKEAAGLLKLVSDLSSGNEFVDPEKLKPELGRVGVNLFDPKVTKSIQTLYEKGFIRLGIALNTESKWELIIIL